MIGIPVGTVLGVLTAANEVFQSLTETAAIYAVMLFGVIQFDKRVLQPIGRWWNERR